MDSKKSVQSLAETIHSLLGLRKAHLTSAWVKSVCNIIKNLPSEASSANSKPKTFQTRDPYDNKDDESDTVVLKIKEELSILTAYLNQLNLQRRQVLNDFLDLKGNIRVFCRLRPFRSFGILSPVSALDSSTILLKVADNKSKSYSFDKVFHPDSSQDEVFSEVEPVIKSVLDGYNACIFAYGQTGTGKTFTMEGTADSPGIVPRAIEAIFKQAMDSNHAFLINFSMLEIYLGNLRDLLVTHPTKPTDPMPPCLSIQTDPNGGIEINNLVAIQVSDFNQALKLYRLGCQFRSTASTNSNITSSRSHCMIRISINCFDAPERHREANKIWLVDLGGSERVLKTKAWGRRLDEGKAINLSLSALGDVINALQRKKRHIPYRNTKLTQVLKDSIGEDSKSLMLVHVSPKEEDLCETICSLNFATRVKSIHLGHEESKEERRCKEEAMTNLLQRMKNIEDERQNVRRDIKKLNEKLENLTGIALSSKENLEVSYLSAEETSYDLEVTKNRVGDVIPAPSSRLPRFMRPTICSRRKSGMDNQTPEGRDLVLERRRRLSSHRAESVTFPVKKSSEYNSECSISRSTCLVGLNTKSNADNETEYSQDISESDIKMVVFQDHEKSQGTSIRQKARVSHLEKNGNGEIYKCNSTKISRVDSWLHGPTISSYTHRSKQVLAIPTSEEKPKCKRRTKAEILRDENVSIYECMTQKVVSHNNMEEQIDVEGVERSISEVMINKPIMMLKDLFDEESRSMFISPSPAPDGQTMIQAQDSVNGSLIEGGECGTPSPPIVGYGGISHCKDDDGVMSIMEADKGETQCSDSSTLELNMYQISLSNLDKSVYSKNNSGGPISILELESHCEELPTETVTEDGEKENSNASSQFSPEETRHGLLKPRSQRALFMENPNQKDLTVQFVNLQGSLQSKGICYILRQKFQILCASALLVLGFHDLGLDHDFFYGLML